VKLNKAALQDVFAHCLIALGIDRATRALLWRDRVAVLLYHDPKPDTLDQHLTYLRTICDLVPLDAVGLPGTGRPRAAITLDDGYATNASLLPVFIKHKVRPTIFVCSRFVGRPARHWWMHPGAKQIGIERLKRLKNEERLSELRKYGYEQAGEYFATGLTIDQMHAMRPFVDFQAHTRFHPILTRCDESECEQEITDCKTELESMLGYKCEHFAYPNGNYGMREVHIVRASGYKTARTCDLGWNDHRTDPHRLKTIVINDDASLPWFVAQLTGIPVFLRYLRHGGNLKGRVPQI
jgi:peptidoglycan/xylan/chitin deacetylase (PgdA/CDA1 family)